MFKSKVHDDNESLDVLQKQIQALQASIGTLTQTVDHLLNVATETRQLVGPFGTPMPDGSMLVQTIHGVKFLIDPNDRIMAPQLIIYRQWEAEMTRLFLHNLDPSTVFVDVGANFGYFTVLGANRIGASGSGQVYAYEPNPRLVPLLRANCEINWSMAPVTISDAAVGAGEGSATISVPLNGAANATLSDVGGDCARHDVKVVSLDDSLPEDLKVDWLKIDVEGHELGVLQGARRVIARSPDVRIVMEWSVNQMRDAGVSADDMIAMFRELGLVAASVPDSGRISDTEVIRFDRLGEIAYDNILLWRP